MRPWEENTDRVNSLRFFFPDYRCKGQVPECRKEGGQMGEEEERDVGQVEQQEEVAESPTEGEQEKEIQIDPYRLNMLLERMRDEQNLVLGIFGGAVGAAMGAALWAAITVITNYQIGYMAIAVGILAGFGVRYLGKGIDTSFQIAGAVLSLVGCLVGNLAVILIFTSRETGIAMSELISELTPGVVIELFRMTFSIIDLLFYGLALSIGYKVAVRQIPQKELEKLAIR